MRAISALLVVAVSAGVLAAAPAGEAQSGSFQASGPPGATGCSEPGGGVTGRHELTVETAGTLLLETPPFRGNWDIAVFDAAGELLATSDSWQPTLSNGSERLTVAVEGGQRVTLAACNYQSVQTTLTTRYHLAPAAPGAAPAHGLRAIEPGELPDLREELPVTIVLVGYDESEVDATELLAPLADTSRPIARAPLWYGIEAPLGIRYDYRYRVVRADAAYEAAVFAELARLARPAPLTAYQLAYNAQSSNVLEVADNHRIPAVEVERWLATHPPAGVDTTLPTVFLLDWYGREDFRHHIYVKRGEPDPDTGFEAGNEDWTGVIAWGGTPPEDTAAAGSAARVWFHDLSAGPDWRTGNWNVDDEDIDGWPGADRRLPPRWEYRDGGFRRPDALPTDLADLIRYVAVNLLFTPSPLYPPAITPPELPASVDLHLHGHRGEPGQPWRESHVDADRLRTAMSAVMSDVEVTSRSTAGDLHERSHLLCFAGAQDPSWEAPGCSPEHPYPAVANLFVHHAEDRADRAATERYAADGFLYAVPDATGLTGCMAWADDNWRTGVQSFVFAQMSSRCLQWYGFTNLMVHEYGHHVGLAHPHDGYDSETSLAYGPWGEHYFVWVGDEVSSVMSYLPLEHDFSQFDRDNLQRWRTAAFLDAVNDIAADVIAHADADDVSRQLADADLAVVAATEAFAGHDYAGALAAAQRAYRHARSAARTLGITVDGSREGWQLQTTGIPAPVAIEQRYAATDRFADVGNGVPVMDLVPLHHRSDARRLDRPALLASTGSHLQPEHRHPAGATHLPAPSTTNPRQGNR